MSKKSRMRTQQLPKSVTVPFVINELTEDEHVLLFGQALKNTSLPENKDESSSSNQLLKKRKSTIKLPNRVSQ